MLNKEERLLKAEKQIEGLIEAKEKIERKMEIRNEVERFVKEQEKGLLKYSLDIFKIIVVLAAVGTSGYKALDAPWIQSLIK